MKGRSRSSVGLVGW